MELQLQTQGVGVEGGAVKLPEAVNRDAVREAKKNLFEWVGTPVGKVVSSIAALATLTAGVTIGAIKYGKVSGTELGQSKPGISGDIDPSGPKNPSTENPPAIVDNNPTEKPGVVDNKNWDEASVKNAVRDKGWQRVAVYSNELTASNGKGDRELSINLNDFTWRIRNEKVTTIITGTSIESIPNASEVK